MRLPFIDVRRTPRPTTTIALLALSLAIALLTACQPATGPTFDPAIKLSANVMPAHITPNPDVPGNPENGRALFTNSKFYPPNGCASCHTLYNLGTGTYPGAPNLTNVSLRPTLADNALQNTPAQMKAWIMDPPSQKQGAKMPKLNVSDAEAQDLVAFLYSQPYNPVQ